MNITVDKADLLFVLQSVAGIVPDNDDHCRCIAARAIANLERVQDRHNAAVEALDALMRLSDGRAP